MNPNQQNPQNVPPVPPVEPQPQFSQPSQPVATPPISQQAPTQPQPQLQQPQYQQTTIPTALPQQPVVPTMQPAQDSRYIAANQSNGYINAAPVATPQTGKKQKIIFIVAAIALIIVATAVAAVAISQSRSDSPSKTTTSQNETAALSLDQARTALTSTTSIEDVTNVVNRFLTPYNITFSTDKRVAAIMSDIGGQSVVESELPKLKQASKVLIEEVSKYPAKWLAASDTDTIGMISDLSYVFNGQNATVAGLAGIGQGTLILNLEIMAAPNVGESEYENFARDTVHHELFHMFDWAIGTYNDQAWTRLNDPSFVYLQQTGSTVTTTYDPTASPGFVSGYAQQNMFEDKAETYTFIAGIGHYDALMTRVKNDSILKSKVAYIKRIVAQHAPEMDDAYLQNMSNTKVVQNIKLKDIDYKKLDQIIEQHSLMHSIPQPN